MLAVSSVFDLRNNPDVLCFIAAYNGVIDDYSMYNNKVYVGSGVTVSERSSASAVGSTYNIVLPRSGHITNGLLVSLESDLIYGCYTVICDGKIPFVFGTPRDYFGVYTYDFNWWYYYHYVIFRSVYSSGVVCSSSSVCCKSVPIQLVIDSMKFAVKSYCSSGKETSLFTTPNTKYLHIGVLWNLDFQSLQPVTHMYTVYSPTFSYFLVCRGTVFGI